MPPAARGRKKSYHRVSRMCSTGQNGSRLQSLFWPKCPAPPPLFDAHSHYVARTPASQPEYREGVGGSKHEPFPWIPSGQVTAFLRVVASMEKGASLVGRVADVGCINTFRWPVSDSCSLSILSMLSDCIHLPPRGPELPQ